MKIFDEFPRPWLFIPEDREHPLKHDPRVCMILDADGKIVMRTPTYSGDGEEIDELLWPDAMSELVMIINAYEDKQCSE